MDNNDLKTDGILNDETIEKKSILGKFNIKHIVIIVICLITLLSYFVMNINGAFLDIDELIEEAGVLSEEGNYKKANKFYYRVLDKDSSLSGIKVKIVENIMKDEGAELAKEELKEFILTDDSLVLFYKLVEIFENSAGINIEEAYKEILTLVKGEDEKSIVIYKKLILLNYDNSERIIELKLNLVDIYLKTNKQDAIKILQELAYDFDVSDEVYKLLLDSLSTDEKEKELRKLYLHKPDNEFIVQTYDSTFPSIVDYVVNLDERSFQLEFPNSKIDKIKVYINKRVENSGRAPITKVDGLFKIYLEDSWNGETTNILFDCYQGDELVETYYLNNFLNAVIQFLEKADIENTEHLILRGLDLEDVADRINPKLLKSLHIISEASYAFQEIEASKKILDIEHLENYVNLRILSTNKTEIKNFDKINLLNEIEHLFFIGEGISLDELNHLDNLKSISITNDFIDLNIFNENDALKYLKINTDDYEGSFDGFKNNIDQLVLHLPNIDLNLLDGSQSLKKLDIVSGKVTGELTDFNNLKVLKIKVNKFDAVFKGLSSLEKLIVESKHSISPNTLSGLSGENLFYLIAYNLSGELDMVPIFENIEHIRILVSPKLNGNVEHFSKYPNLISLNLAGSNNLSGKFELNKDSKFNFNNRILRVGQKFENINAIARDWLSTYLTLSNKGYATFNNESMYGHMFDGIQEEKDNYAYLENNGEIHLYDIDYFVNYHSTDSILKHRIVFEIIDSSSVKVKTRLSCDKAATCTGDVFKILD